MIQSSAIESSPKIIPLSCGGFISTSFVFNNTLTQAAANSIYANKSTIDGSNAAIGSNKKVNFKTNAERIQYLLGKMASSVQ
jgi:hypothetical protein